MRKVSFGFGRMYLREQQTAIGRLIQDGAGFRNDDDGTKLVSKRTTKEINRVHPTLRRGSLRFGQMCRLGPSYA